MTLNLENIDTTPITSAEWKAKVIEKMKAAPEDCGTYTFLNAQAHWITRAPGATMEEYNDLLFQLYEIHKDHCLNKHLYT